MDTPTWNEIYRNFSGGSPFEDIYRGFGKCDLDHLPPIVNKRDHAVLFQLPIGDDLNQPPQPYKGEKLWDGNHVRLPCAKQNEYTKESNVSQFNS